MEPILYPQPCAARSRRLQPEALFDLLDQRDEGFVRLRQMLVGGSEDADMGGDVFARMARGQTAIVSQIAADGDRLLGARGAQAYCLACPPSKATQPRSTISETWLARILASVTG